MPAFDSCFAREIMAFQLRNYGSSLSICRLVFDIRFIWLSSWTNSYQCSRRAFKFWHLYLNYQFNDAKKFLNSLKNPHNLQILSRPWKYARRSKSGTFALLIIYVKYITFLKEWECKIDSWSFFPITVQCSKVWPHWMYLYTFMQGLFAAKLVFTHLNW